MEQLSPCTATTEPVLQGPEAATPEPTHPGARDLQQEKPASEKAGSAPGEQPLPEQLEPAHSSEDPEESQGCTPYPRLAQSL